MNPETRAYLLKTEIETNHNHIQIWWNVESKAFIEDRIQSPLLDMCLFLGDSLSIVEQINFDVRIGQPSDIHPW